MSIVYQCYVGLSNAFAETYETGSRCVEHGGTWTAQGNGFISMQSDIRSGCYKVLDNISISQQ